MTNCLVQRLRKFGASTSLRVNRAPDLKAANKPKTLLMQVRKNDNSPESIEYEAFKKQIISGDIGPDTHVRDRVLTDDQWMSADNLGIFHKMSPSKHPHVRILKRKLRQEARRM